MKENIYLSKKHTNALKGIFAITVVIHHLYQYTGMFAGSIIGTILQVSGFLSVAMFFFFSGYGLMFSSKNEGYIKTFFRKRFLPLYCFYVVLIILYSLWTLLLEKTISIKTVFLSFFFGGTIVTNGWYLQTTFVSYLIFLLIFKFVKKPKSQISCFGIATILYCFICYLLGLGINWYQTFPCMFLGMLFCYKKDNLDVLMKKHVCVVFVLSFILFVTCLILSRYGKIGILFSMLYSVFFVCVVVAISYILCKTPVINNRIFSLLGKYSFEIYVSHGFFLRLIKLKFIENVFIYILVVILCTFVTSIIMKIIYAKIISLFNKTNICRESH